VANSQTGQLENWPDGKLTNRVNDYLANWLDGKLGERERERERANIGIFFTDNIMSDAATSFRDLAIRRLNICPTDLGLYGQLYLWPTG
jgi:hypothetical protein